MQNIFFDYNMSQMSPDYASLKNTKSKRKTQSHLDKENNIYQKSEFLQKNVNKRLCLGTLSSNKPVEQLISAAKSLDLCLSSQNSQDSHDSGFSLSQNFSSPMRTDLNESIEMSQADMDELNSCCLQNSAFNNRLLNSSVTSANDSFTARRCLFGSSPRSETPKKALFENNDDSYTTSHVQQSLTPKTKIGKKNQITPISIRRQSSMKIGESNAFTTFAEQSITSIEKMLQDTSKKCLKNQHDLIKKSLDIECEVTSSHEPVTTTHRLIGDRSKYHLLPTITSIKHNDLNIISTETLKQVLSGKYDSEIDSVMVIDSRYPYEYEGGHIQNAENLYTKEQVFEKFLNSDKLKNMTEKANINGKRAVIIFHCEFSSERGPSMLRFLRNQDRTLNKDSYPNLFYPELYLLEGGYKAFYEQNKEQCEPRTYKPMLHADHVNDLKHFRAKTKTWNRQGSAVNMSANVKNCFKSRLQRFPRSTLF